VSVAVSARTSGLTPSFAFRLQSYRLYSLSFVRRPFLGRSYPSEELMERGPLARRRVGMGVLSAT
jgi:hypothetical protein